MYRSIRICFPLLFLIVAGKISLAQTASFNFSHASQPVSGWVDVVGDPYDSVITATDPATGIHISSVSTSNWFNDNGISSYDGGGQSNGTFFPAAVLHNYWFQNAVHASYNAAIPQLIVSGLNPDSVYTFKIAGSLAVFVGTVYEANPTRYTVTGAVVNGPVDVNSDYNTANGAIFPNVAPDAGGQVKIYINSYGPSNFAPIGGLQIIRGRTAGPAPAISFTRPYNGNILPEDGNVQLNVNATDSISTITRVEFYRGSILLGVDSTAPYSFTWLNPDPGSYIVTARAIDQLGYTASASVSFSVESLNYFWSTTGNIATGADSSFIGTVDTNRFVIRTNNVPRMTFLSDGTIGIGTNDPKGNALAVNGTGIFTKVKVKPIANWPDYVFRKDFHLPGLPELESYVREHHHLPGIASEQEVTAAGIDVGEQQAALLKKIEELTLYLIDQNKTLEAQKGMLKSQQRQIDELKALINNCQKK